MKSCLAVEYLVRSEFVHSPAQYNGLFFQTTPIGIAFLKGHVGIVDFFLNQAKVDVNFKDDEGRVSCFWLAIFGEKFSCLFVSPLII